MERRRFTKSDVRGAIGPFNSRQVQIPTEQGVELAAQIANDPLFRMQVAKIVISSKRDLKREVCAVNRIKKDTVDRFGNQQSFNTNVARAAYLVVHNHYLSMLNGRGRN